MGLFSSLGFLGYAYSESNSKTKAQSSQLKADISQYTENTSEFANILDCDKLEFNLKQRCNDEFIQNYAQGKSTQELLATMEQARLQNPTVENSCHPIAHAIGRYTLDQTGNVGDAFESCDYSCHSGCYHGVMERLFLKDQDLSDTQHVSKEQLEVKVPSICNEENFANPTSSVIFQCLHGIGHAILFSLEYNLDDALSTCDKLGNGYERSSCYGGVFMENVTAFEKGKRDIKLEDPHYPCSRLDDKYKNDCYVMQTSVMADIGLSVEQQAQECLKAGNYSGNCFVSIGRDLSNQVRTENGNFVIDICENKSGEYSRNCINGVIYALIDNTWSGEFAISFCSTLQKNDNETYCYDSASRYLQGVYNKSDDDLKTECTRVSGEHNDKCLESVN